MARYIELPNHADERGGLVVLEKCLNFDIKRAFWITNPKGVRGGHGHKETIQALIAVNGACKVIVKNQGEHEYILDRANIALILEPDDWHQMLDFAPNTVLLSLASHYYDAGDYVTEPKDMIA